MSFLRTDSFVSVTSFSMVSILWRISTELFKTSCFTVYILSLNIVLCLVSLLLFLKDPTSFNENSTICQGISKQCQANLEMSCF